MKKGFVIQIHRTGTKVVTTSDLLVAFYDTTSVSRILPAGSEGTVFGIENSSPDFLLYTVTFKDLDWSLKHVPVWALKLVE